MNPRPSAPKTDQTAYGNLLILREIKCFRLNCLPRASRTLLIFVALGCFDSYKFDYSDDFVELLFLRRSNVQTANRRIR